MEVLIMLLTIFVLAILVVIGIAVGSVVITQKSNPSAD